MNLIGAVQIRVWDMTILNGVSNGNVMVGRRKLSIVSFTGEV